MAPWNGPNKGRIAFFDMGSGINSRMLQLGGKRRSTIMLKKGIQAAIVIANRLFSPLGKLAGRAIYSM